MTGQVSAAQTRQSKRAGQGRANTIERTIRRSPAPTECDGQGAAAPRARNAVAASRANDAARAEDRLPGSQPNPASDGGETTAKPLPETKAHAPSSQPSPQGARAASARTAATFAPPHAKDDHGHLPLYAQSPHAVIEDEAPVHFRYAAHAAGDRRFVNPLICEIVELWRQRQDMVRAQQKLTLQIKAICRRFCAGDKTDAAKLYASISNGMGHPHAEACAAAVAPLRMASRPIEESRAALEKRLTKLGDQLPIAHVCADIRGVNGKTLASIVGECGDLSAYRSVSAVWKRAGLAVIEGERQRRKAGDAALIHGYAPERHAVFWNIAQALIKSQGTGDAAGPYRRIYDERKAYERPRVESDGHAHNRAMRYMLKRLVRDLVVAWRAVQ